MSTPSSGLAVVAFSFVASVTRGVVMGISTLLSEDDIA
jgi:hypothetical protein